VKVCDFRILAGLFVLLFSRCDRNPFPQGERLYNAHCASCHMEDGTGLVAWYPPLKKSDYLLKNQSMLPCIIRFGLEESITVNGVVFDLPMDGFPQLDEAEINNLINFISSRWGDKRFVQPETISEQLTECSEQE